MAACDEARRLLAWAGEDEYVIYRYEGEAEADEERRARQAVLQNLSRLRTWVESLLAKREVAEGG